MFASLLTAFFFALSGTLAARSVRCLGSRRANAARLLVSWVVLGIGAHVWGQGLHGGVWIWFFLSGLVGFGLGDWAMFESIPRIGPGLTVLLCQCLAAPLAALVEWLWLGTRLTPLQLAASALILIGVAVAVRPDQRLPIQPCLWQGIGFGVLAAVGQGLGAVFSRVAYQYAQVPLDGFTAAYQRLWGGLAFTLVAWLIFRFPKQGTVDWKQGTPWVLANALAGSILGVSCYQWALQTQPSGVVLPLVATTPLMILPLAYFLEGTRPTGRAMIGATISVTGVVLMNLFR